MEEYIYTVLNFLNEYYLCVLSATAVALWIYAFVNWARNPYRRQNKKIAYCSRILSSYPDKAQIYANLLPDVYRRQWRAFVNSGADKPSRVFEFVAVRSRMRLIWLLVLSIAVNLMYIAVFALVNPQIGFLIYQVAFMLAFGLIIVAYKTICRKNERQARQIYARLVALLNRVASLPKNQDTIVDETVRKLNSLKNGAVTDTVVGEASALLRGKGLEGERSVEQQRKLNTALNGLLQAYSRTSPMGQRGTCTK